MRLFLRSIEEFADENWKFYIPAFYFMKLQMVNQILLILLFIASLALLVLLCYYCTTISGCLQNHKRRWDRTDWFNTQRSLLLCQQNYYEQKHILKLEKCTQTKIPKKAVGVSAVENFTHIELPIVHSVAQVSQLTKHSELS